MTGSASELARRLGEYAEAVCREYLSNGHRWGNHWMVGDVRNKCGRSMHVRLKAVGGKAAGKWVDEQSGEHGDLLDAWIAPIFDDDPRYARIRLAACLLADVAWQAHPDFRAERGLDMALHGNWVGIDAPGRVMMAEALFNNFGGGPELPDKQIASLLTPRELECAARWGMAMRVGQRLSGGVATSLQRTALRREGDRLYLVVRPGEEALYGETVEKRLKRLAASLGCKAGLKVAR